MKDAKRVDFTAHYCTENQRVLLEHPLELLRTNEAVLEALGAQRLPDPTTAGDFCRRFETDDQCSLISEQDS